MVGGCAAMGAEVSSGPVATAGAERHQAHATGGATTAELFLCIGPAASCPSTGTVNPTPPYQPMLAMQFGQTWTGTMDAYANDSSAITGTISLEDSYNGGPEQTYCTLNVAAGGTCAASVGTTMGTAVGTHVLTAVYSGDATHAGAVSAAVTIVVSQETTSESLVGTPNPAVAGQVVTLTATVGGSYAAPAGAVTFMYGGAVIGTATLVGNSSGTSATATITTSTLPVGQDTISAVYASTTDFASASATMTETITPAPTGSFTLSVTPEPATVGVGLGAALTVTVTPANGFAEDVNLSCSNLPQEAACVFGTPTIAGGSGATTLIVQTTAPHSCGTTTPYFLGDGGGGGSIFSRSNAGVAMAGLFALFLPLRRRRWLRLMIAVVAIAGAAPMTGCGNCTDLGTRPATYTIEVTGTAADSSTTVSQAVTVNVTI